jgi:hypothetical protein
MDIQDATGEKIKILADTHAFGIRKLIPLGGSYGLVIPKMWVTANCVEIDGEYYLKLNVVNNELRFSSISPDDIEGIEIKEKNDRLR